MCLVGDFVYCCGGLNESSILKSCERFSLKNEKWSSDVPDMNYEKFSMTMMLLDKTWLYSFGGFNENWKDNL